MSRSLPTRIPQNDYLLLRGFENASPDGIHVIPPEKVFPFDDCEDIHNKNLVEPAVSRARKVTYPQPFRETRTRKDTIPTRCTSKQRSSEFSNPPSRVPFPNDRWLDVVQSRTLLDSQPSTDNDNKCSTNLDAPLLSVRSFPTSIRLPLSKRIPNRSDDREDTLLPVPGPCRDQWFIENLRPVGFEISLKRLCVI